MNGVGHLSYVGFIFPENSRNGNTYQKGILIEMPGRYYDAESIQNLTNELIEVLRYALFYNAEIANASKTNYSYLFDLLLALTPTEEQLKMIHLH